MGLVQRTVPRRMLRSNRISSCAAVALAVLALHAGSRPAAAAVNVEAAGRLLCNGAAMAGVRVDLMVKSPLDLTGTQKDTGVTDASGRYHLRGAGGNSFGPPESYVRAVYVAAFDGPPPATARVVDEIGSVRSDNGRAFPWHSGVIDMGAQNFGGIDCGLWQQLQRVVQDYEDEISAGFGGIALPYANLDVLRWSAIFTGTPWTSLDTIHWPTNYPAFPRSVFHETGHSLRHSFDGDPGHFSWDATRFVYARFHDVGDDTNEGFAFNEGWAELWETRTTTPPWKRNYVNSPPRWSVEGDVAADLRHLIDDCAATYGGMVSVLKNHPGAIHSRDEFVASFKADFPNACRTGAPPPPSPPGSCAAGSVSQQFYDGVVGCAGSVAQKDAAALCGGGFSLCSAVQYQHALHSLKPAHDYWTKDQLNLDDVAGACAARHAGGTACPAASLHVCTPSGDDPEGNSCEQTNCSLDPRAGEESPLNAFLGGCGAADTTAGAVCCPTPALVAPEPVPTPEELKRLRDRDHATLLQAIASLESQVDAARGAAVLPATCGDPQACGKALQALTLPALLQGAIDLHRAYLRHMEASTASNQDLQAQEAKGTFEDSWRSAGRTYRKELLAIRRKALKDALDALRAALAAPTTAATARVLADELRGQLAALDKLDDPQQKASPDLQTWKPEQWLRLAGTPPKP
jgi:hypothetical protein